MEGNVVVPRQFCGDEELEQDSKRMEITDTEVHKRERASVPLFHDLCDHHPRLHRPEVTPKTTDLASSTISFRDAVWMQSDSEKTCDRQHHPH